MKLEYIGLKKDGERAFQEITGIEWMPGSVHEVEARHAQKLLDHPTLWKRADEQTTLATAITTPPASLNPGIPAWAKTGIDAGLSDEQLESLAEVGGPETEQGAKLWLELTGKAFGNVEPPAPQSIIRLPDGMTRILDGLSKEALHDMAKELRVKVHPASGPAKVTEALMAAFPVKG
jgi:hypothetical protein